MRKYEEITKFVIRRNLCPVCSSEEFNSVYKRSYQDELISKFMEIAYQGNAEMDMIKDADFELVTCRKCNLIFQPNVLNDEGLQQLYNKWIDPELAEGWKRKALFDESIVSFKVLNVVKQYFSRDPSTIKILDYGAGLGKFLSLAKAMGFNVFALEYSKERISYIEKQGLQAISFEEIRSHKFDLISIDQVLEHLTDPGDVLRSVKPVLKENGLIYLSVPNCRGIEDKIRKSHLISDSERLFDHFMSMGISALQHVNYFNNSNLKKLIRDCGYTLVFKPFLETTSSLISKNPIKPVLGPFNRYFFGTTFFLKKGSN